VLHTLSYFITTSIYDIWIAFIAAPTFNLGSDASLSAFVHGAIGPNLTLDRHSVIPHIWLSRDSLSAIAPSRARSKSINSLTTVIVSASLSNTLMKLPAFPSQFGKFYTNGSLTSLEVLLSTGSPAVNRLTRQSEARAIFDPIWKKATEKRLIQRSLIPFRLGLIVFRRLHTATTTTPLTTRTLSIE
jgi:hypothetical protein